MSTTILQATKRGALLLLYFLITAACGLGTLVGDEEVSVETAVAQTVAANSAVDAQIQQTVDAALATQGAGTQATDPNAPDIADPNTAMQPIQPTADTSIPSGTPQLSVGFDSVNVRAGPGTNYQVIRVLLRDSVVNVVAKNQGGDWFLIDLPGGERGWIANSVTNPVVAADFVNVSVAATIPAPPPTATATATVTPLPTSTSTATATTIATTATATTAAPTATATATATQASSPPLPSAIKVINRSGVTICFLFIDLSTSPVWTVDRLGSDILQDGFEISFPDSMFPAGQYDFRAEDCNGDPVKEQFSNLIDAAVFGTFVWEIFP